MPVVPKAKIDTLKTAFEQWRANEVYLTGGVVYRVRGTGCEAPWNALVNRAFPNPSDLAEAANLYASTGVVCVGTAVINLTHPLSPDSIARLFTVVAAVGNVCYMGAGTNGINGYRFMFKSHDAQMAFIVAMLSHGHEWYQIK